MGATSNPSGSDRGVGRRAERFTDLLSLSLSRVGRCRAEMDSCRQWGRQNQLVDVDGNGAPRGSFRGSSTCVRPGSGATTGASP
jgi:hypothetical protein